MLKTLVAAGFVVALAGCAVAPGYNYGYAQPGYYGYGYAPGYEPAYGGVNIGIWGGGPDHYHGDRYYRGGGHGGPWHGGGHGGHGGGGHGGGGHGR